MTEKSTLETPDEFTSKIRGFLKCIDFDVTLGKEKEFIHFSRGFVNIDIVGVQLLG